MIWGVIWESVSVLFPPPPTFALYLFFSLAHSRWWRGSKRSQTDRMESARFSFPFNNREGRRNADSEPDGGALTGAPEK